MSTNTTPNVETMTGPELVAYYNEITGESVKRFSTRAAGLARIEKALASQPAPKAVEPEPTPKPQSGTKNVKRNPADPNHRRTRFDLWPDDEQKSVRPGSKREKVLSLLRRKNGATVSEVMDEIGWDYRTACDGIRLIHVYVGYGLAEDEQGRIRATTNADLK